MLTITTTTETLLMLLAAAAVAIIFIAVAVYFCVKAGRYAWRKADKSFDDRYLNKTEKKGQ